VEIARGLGLESSFATGGDLPFVRVAMVVPNQAQLNALWYVRGLAGAVHGEGSAVFEDTRVDSVEDGKPCRVSSANGVILAQHVVHATHTPVSLEMPMQVRVAPYMSYVIAVTLDAPGPNGLMWDTMEPYHYLRSYTLPDGRAVVLIGGEDHKTGQDQDTAARFGALAAYARERFRVQDIGWQWCNEVFEPADGLPYIGPLGAHRHVSVGTGYAGNGLTFGTLAGLGLADALLGRGDAPIRPMSPRRVHGRGVGHFLKENANVAWRLIRDRIHGDDERSELTPGEGRVVRLDGRKVALYRDPQGDVHAMSAVCPHAGGIVQWNKADCTWDCPLHGSRFGAHGKVLNGPTTADLSPVEEPSEEDLAPTS
jgi:nitrite reductase/ring-hydroxylating ferredoxin subunit